jgi:di/tricarboxylate transporter
MAIGWAVAVVLLAVFGVVPMSIAALTGAAGMVLSRCVTGDEALRSIVGGIIALLAGVLALGRALEVTGGAGLLANGLVSVAGDLGPWALVAALYLVTTLLTETLSNVAAATLLAPLAFATAEQLAISPRPLVMAIAFAASASFLTPFGYQTNLLVYGPGRYRFSDFARVGAPLNLMFWIVATALIPVIYPF